MTVFPFTDQFQVHSQEEICSSVSRDRLTSVSLVQKWNGMRYIRVLHGGRGMPKVNAEIEGQFEACEINAYGDLMIVMTKRLAGENMRYDYQSYTIEKNTLGLSVVPFEGYSSVREVSLSSLLENS